MNRSAAVGAGSDKTRPKQPSPIRSRPSSSTSAVPAAGCCAAARPMSWNGVPWPPTCELLTMIKRNVNARFALLSPVLPLLCLSATAQVTAPGAMDMGVDRGADATLILQNEREPDWGTQLATPEGRQQVFERKMRDARASYPDFARVLGVDTTTADKVLALLVEDEIAIATGVSEMQRNS